MIFYINELLLIQNKCKLNKNIIVYNKESFPKIENDCFFFCTIEDTRIINSIKNNCKYKIYMFYFDLKISDFLPAIQDEYLNFEGMYKQVCQLSNYDIGNFCRSNSGAKLWSGQILDAGLIQIIKNRLQPDDLLYLSSPKLLRKEYRCWVINETVIEIQEYSKFNLAVQKEIKSKDCIFFKKTEEIAENIKPYVENISKYWTPDELFTVDIGIFGIDLKIIEYNCFSTSGFYNADVNKICNEVIKYYEK